MRVYSSIASRRDVLRAAAAAALSAAGVEGALAAKSKRSQVEVAYRGSPNGTERCEICAPFLPPDQCRTVVGPVSRQGWCKIYVGA